MAGHLTLCWHEHNNSLVSFLQTLLNDDSSLDCTLAADGNYLRAHKVVLSASSPYFQLLFSQEKNKNPIVILKDVEFECLQWIIDFVYRGEVQVRDTHLDSFLEVARSLQIKGLDARLQEQQTQSSHLATPMPSPEHYGDQGHYVAEDQNHCGGSEQDPCRPSEQEPSGSSDREPYGASDQAMEKDDDVYDTVNENDDDDDCKVVEVVHGTKSKESFGPYQSQAGGVESIKIESTFSISHSPSSSSEDELEDTNHESIHESKKLINGMIEPQIDLKKTGTHCGKTGENFESYLPNSASSSTEDELEDTGALERPRFSPSPVALSASTLIQETNHESKKLINGTIEPQLDLKKTGTHCGKTGCLRLPSPDRTLEQNTQRGGLHPSSGGCSEHKNRSLRCTCDSGKRNGTYLSAYGESLPKCFVKVSKLRIPKKDEQRKHSREITCQRTEKMTQASLTDTENVPVKSEAIEGTVRGTESSYGELVANTELLSDVSTPKKDSRTESVSRNALSQERPSEAPDPKKRQSGGKNRLRFSCFYCPKKFRRSNDYNVHRRRHTGERPFRCLICLQNFVQSGDLSRHRRVHTGERSYRCSYCPKAFSREESLKNHTRLHTGERPYKCVCGKAFASQSRLINHRKVHTRGQYICDECGDDFRNKPALAQHWRSTHAPKKRDDRKDSKKRT